MNESSSIVGCGETKRTQHSRGRLEITAEQGTTWLMITDSLVQAQPNFFDGLRVLKQDGQKADDAEVPIHLWDSMFLRDREEDDCITHAVVNDWQLGLRLFRNVHLGLWRRRLFRSWITFARARTDKALSVKLGCKVGCFKVVQQSFDWTYQWSDDGGKDRYQAWLRRPRESRSLKDSMVSARDALRRTADCSWWEWLEGSSLLFWKWPDSHFGWARDGQPHFQTGELPRFTKPQDPPKRKEDGAKMKAKVDKVRSRDYIEYGWVKSLTHMFYVEKGLTDIRMVYNGTSSGLNDVLWAPHFGLPIMQHTLRSLRPGYFQCDMDVGEMFLNFWLNTSLRPYAGVDITHVQDTSAKAPHWEKKRDRKWERWSRNFMGLTDSPYRSLQLMIKAKFIAYGDRLDAANPFQ